MSNLPIFENPPFQNELDESYQVEINPLGGDINKGPIEFNIIGNSDFINLNATTLELRVKISKADGTTYAKDSEVAFTNYTLHSLFSDIVVTINDTIVEGGEQTYSLKALMGTLFSYSKDTMTDQLFASGFVKDECGKADDVTNTGYVARKAWTNDGASKEFYGKLFIDLFQQHRYLIGNVHMKIKLIKAANAYAIWTNIFGERPKVVFESAKLYLKKIKLHPDLFSIYATHLSKGAIMHYPLARTEITTIPANAGILDISREQLFYGRVPKLLVMAMIDNEANSGVYEKNPFNFEHFNVKHVDLRLDGASKPLLPLTPNFKDGKCLREYMSLMETMNILGKDASLPITYADYLNGYTFFAWNLTPDYEVQSQDPSRRSDIRLDVKFAEATPKFMNIVLYSVFDSTIIIEGSGYVATDFKDY